MKYVILALPILMNNMIFYVQDESTKCMICVIIALPILMYNMNFYVWDGYSGVQILNMKNKY